MTSPRILIVEDELIIATGLERRLEKMKYPVVGVSANGEEALRMAGELQPDLILMDISLGKGIDGIQAATLIHQIHDIPIVYLTAYSDSTTIERAKLTEPFGYILKPYEDRDLQTAIEIGIYKHRMGRQLRENEQWLSATLASIGDGVIATDETGRVRLINSRAEQLTGWQAKEAIGRDILEVFRIVNEQSWEPILNPLVEAISTGRAIFLPENTLLLSKDGTDYPIEDSAAPIFDVHGKVAGAVLVFRDISERRRLEEHLRQAQKMEAIGRLAGGIAHDFNNIMTIITGYSEMLLAGEVSPEEQKEVLGQINDASKRAASLTKQILAFSRKQVLIPSVLNLNLIIRDMSGMIPRLIGEHIQYSTQLEPNVGEIKADPTQIGQVILNLAANARDAMPEGGRLIISTANRRFHETWCETTEEIPPGNYVELQVQDTGSGMSEEVLRHVFEPFFTTKEVGKGTGLGLSTVYGIVKQSGGYIHITSKVGEGSTVRVFLPLIEDKTESLKESNQPTPFLGNETILLVEDEPSVRELIKLLLLRAGYTVLEANHGLEAIQINENYSGAIDLLITDVVMPQMNGRELVERMVRSRPAIKVLMMSGYTEGALSLKGIAHSTVGFLSKPFDIQMLTKKVREVLDSDPESSDSSNPSESLEKSF